MYCFKYELCLFVMFKALLIKVAAKDSMNNGDRIFLPVTVQEFPVENHNCHCNEEEVNFIRSLVLYKVLNFSTFFIYIYGAMIVSDM